MSYSSSQIVICQEAGRGIRRHKCKWVYIEFSLFDLKPEMQSFPRRHCALYPSVLAMGWLFIPFIELYTSLGVHMVHPSSSPTCFQPAYHLPLIRWHPLQLLCWTKWLLWIPQQQEQLQIGRHAVSQSAWQRRTRSRHPGPRRSRAPGEKAASSRRHQRKYRRPRGCRRGPR